MKQRSRECFIVMTYYADFSVCQYFPEGDWLCRLIAVGWIESGKPYERGVVPAACVERLRMLRLVTERALPEHSFRGLHACTLCAGLDAHPAELEKAGVSVVFPGDSGIAL